MSGPRPYDEREARRQFIRRRQRLVFTIIVSLLIGVLLIAILFFTGNIGRASGRGTTAQPNYGVAVPCAPRNAKIKRYSQISVRVINGTEHPGLARAVREALTSRGFHTTAVGDTASTQILKRTEIRFGRSAITEAYTVATQFNDAIMVMDDRDDKLLDTVVGSTFNNLNDQTNADAKEGAPITSIPGCVADPSAITHLPKAGAGA